MNSYYFKYHHQIYGQSNCLGQNNLNCYACFLSCLLRKQPSIIFKQSPTQVTRLRYRCGRKNGIVVIIIIIQAYLYLSNAYYVAGLYWVILLLFHLTRCVPLLFPLCYKRKNWEEKKVMRLVQGHSKGKWWRWDLNPGCLQVCTVNHYAIDT